MFRRSTATAGALAALALGFTPGAASVAAQEDYDVVVRADRTAGTIKNLVGMTCGPIASVQGWYDLTPEYNWMRVQSVRLHDCAEVGDIHRVFPRFSADATDPKNYDFKDVDRLVSSIERGGMSVCYRLGYSWSTQIKTPSNYDQFAAICHHIVLHFTQGWAGGFRYTNIEWEVWNEANLLKSWTHSARYFYTFYRKVVAAIRKADPRARVGTCALAVVWPRAYLEDLIASCATNKTPLDFFSWHYYGWGFNQPQPENYARQGRYVRGILDRYGFVQAGNYLTEWNIAHPGKDPRLKTVAGAAYCLASLIFMLDGAIDMTHHYRGDLCDAECGGLFKVSGTRVTPIPRAWAFHVFALLQDTPVRLETTGGDRSGFAALAGRSADGRCVQVVASNFWSRIGDRRLFLRNLPPARRLLQVHAITDRGLVLLHTETLEPGAPVEVALPGPAPWVRFVRLVETAPGGVTLVAGSGAASVGRPQGRFRLHAPGRNGRIYVVLGSLSGSKPGTPFPGNLVLPLNIDGFTLWLFAHYPKRGYDRFIGRLDPDGGDETVIDWRLDALDPAYRGVKLTFAAFLLGAGGIEAVTNAVTVTLQ